MPVKTICACGQMVTMKGRTMTAYEWAELHGLKWQTVKMRRMRGACWEEALRPGLRNGARFNWRFSA